MKEKKYLLVGIFEIILSIFIALSIISYSNNDYIELIKKGIIGGNFNNYTGGIGCFLSHWILILTGYCSIFVILITAQLGIYNISSSLKEKKYSTFIKIFILFILFSLILNSIEIIHNIKPSFNFHIGGLLFYKIAKYITILFGNIGTYLIMILLISAYFIFTIEKTFDFKTPKFLNSIVKSYKNLFKKNEKQTNDINIINIAEKKKTKPTLIKNNKKKLEKHDDNKNMKDTIYEEQLVKSFDNFEINTDSELSEGLLKAMEKIDNTDNLSEEQYTNFSESYKEDNDTITYKLPDISLLPNPEKVNKSISKLEITQTSQRLESKLQEFGIDSKVVAVSPGPIVTLYELKLAPGIKVNKIMQLIDDISLALAGRRVRVIAPIPGKETIGVEVPNTTPEIVFFKEILTSPIFLENKKPLLIILGKNIAGKAFATSLTKMPHLLIAGATGSGKSVCLNSIIASLLFSNTPKDLRLLLIDPKMIEFSIYQDIPHLLTPVVTNPKNSVIALQWAVLEMENRYKMLAKYGSRNIIDFNNKVAKIKKEDKNADIERLNYIVIIIDELADLMMTASADIETSIARLAQMARAVGIHLILATQRPSVNVITGVIKANFPSRIAFQVAQKNDSRIILDMNGAEQLLGKGDMLFLPPGQPLPYRLHGAYISTEETEMLINYWRQYPTQYENILLEEQDSTDKNILEEKDPLFNNAAKIVITQQHGSTSLLQRKLRIGYARAARIMDQLEQAGIVGPTDGSKAREVLVDETYLQYIE